MTYGARSDLVEEVIELARSGRVLQPGGTPPPDVATIGDLEQAKGAAWDDAYGTEEYTWTDIREREMRAVRKGLSALPKAIQANIAGCFALLREILEPQLLGETAELSDEAVADLYNCARARAALGMEATFFETQFRIYRAGGWPCGWRGEYPAGTMLAWFPPSPAGSELRTE